MEKSDSMFPAPNSTAKEIRMMGRGLINLANEILKMKLK
jgi:hypothetical protein